MNPPTVEFVKDALRVAGVATQGRWIFVPRESHHAAGIGREDSESEEMVIYVPDACPNCEQGRLDDNDAAHIAKFDPPTVIALMEDWLRLRERCAALSEALVKIDAIQFDGAVADSLNDTTTCFNRIEEVARAALAKQG